MKRTLVMLAYVALAACGGKQQQAVPQQNTRLKAPLPPAIHRPLPASQPAVATLAPQPGARTVASNSGPTLVTGKVLETMNAAGYTYLRIATPAGDRWAAVREAKVKKGANATVAVQMIADNFESNTLKRKFDHIIFGAIATDAAAAAPVTAAATAPPAAMSSYMGSASEHMKASVDAASISVEKAVDGKTVAEVWAEKSGLQGKPVTIRGKVVKFLPEIMGRNWLHLRDGSGSRDKGDDDITITTTEPLKVGEIVTVTGTLRVDKDFGAGYRYPVIVEDAKVHP